MPVDYKQNMRKKIAKLPPIKPGPRVAWALQEELQPLAYTDTPPAVLLSGGIDSQSVLFALLELDIKPIAFSFAFKDAPSRDFRYAEATAKEFGVEFRPVWLPRSEEHLKKYVRYILNEVKPASGKISKPFVVCTWPQLLAVKLAERMELNDVVSGIHADAYFVLGKTYMMMMRADPTLRMDELVIRMNRSSDISQITTMRCESLKHGIQWHTPYYSARMMAEFMGGYTWTELNKPREKEPIRAAYEEQFKRSKNARHQNFQLGDSGISDHFDMLLKTDWNIPKYTDVRYLLIWLSEHPEVMDGKPPIEKPKPKAKPRAAKPKSSILTRGRL